MKSARFHNDKVSTSKMKMQAVTGVLKWVAMSILILKNILEHMVASWCCD